MVLYMSTLHTLCQPGKCEKCELAWYDMCEKSPLGHGCLCMCPEGQYFRPKGRVKKSKIK